MIDDKLITILSPFFIIVKKYKKNIVMTSHAFSSLKSVHQHVDHPKYTVIPTNTSKSLACCHKHIHTIC